MIYLYSKYAYLIFMLAIATSFIILLFHYLLIGVKGVNLSDYSRVIQRFSITERVSHWIRMLSFIVVSTSGVYLVFQDGGKNIGILHSMNGMVFLVISIFTLMIWYKESIFKVYDREWLRYLGGYLSKEHSSLPAGKFNAGQKILFWLTMVFTFILSITGIILMRSKISQASVNEIILVCHGISAVLVIMLVIGHMYLSLVVNPGTWKVLVNGKVTKEWVDSHHPSWNINQIPKD